MFLCRNVSKKHIHKYSRHIDRVGIRKSRGVKEKDGEFLSGKICCFLLMTTKNKNKKIKRSGWNKKKKGTEKNEKLYVVVFNVLHSKCLIVLLLATIKANLQPI